MPEELIQLTTDPIRKIPQEILLIRMGENFYTKDHKEGSFTLDHDAADKILQEFDSRGIGDISVFLSKTGTAGNRQMFGLRKITTVCMS